MVYPLEKMVKKAGFGIARNEIERKEDLWTSFESIGVRQSAVQ